MTPKTLVYKTLEFNRPERIPRQLWVLPWATNHFPKEYENIKQCFPDDIVHSDFKFKEPPKVSGEAYKIGYFIDEWGCRFECKEEGVLGEVKEPLIKTWADLEKVRPPRECLTVDVDVVNDFCRHTDKFVIAGCCPRPFERIQFLRGTENLMMDVALQEQEFKELLNIVHSFHIEEMNLWAKTNVDSLLFMDDWGAQRSLLISPNSWRALFKPLYKEYIDIAHSHGKKIFMHSDGYILDIIPDLIELGLDAVNSQIFCMGVENVAKFAGKITFWGELDRQHLIPHGSKQDIINAVKMVHKNLYRDGGVIAQLEFGPGANPQNVMTAFETWEQL